MPIFIPNTCSTAIYQPSFFFSNSHPLLESRGLASSPPNFPRRRQPPCRRSPPSLPSSVRFSRSPRPARAFSLLPTCRPNATRTRRSARDRDRASAASRAGPSKIRRRPSPALLLLHPPPASRPAPAARPTRQAEALGLADALAVAAAPAGCGLDPRASPAALGDRAASPVPRACFSLCLSLGDSWTTAPSRRPLPTTGASIHRAPCLLQALHWRRVLPAVLVYTDVLYWVLRRRPSVLL